jgi:hypothetical protein
VPRFVVRVRVSFQAASLSWARMGVAVRNRPRAPRQATRIGVVLVMFWILRHEKEKSGV